MRINTLTTSAIDRIFRAVKWFEKYILPSGNRYNGQLIGPDFVDPDPSSVPSALYNGALPPDSVVPDSSSTAHKVTSMIRVVTPDWANGTSFPRSDWQRWVCGVGGSGTTTNGQDVRTVSGCFSMDVVVDAGTNTKRTLYFDAGILVHVSD